MTIIYFIIALGLLVLIHEWGHFIVARKSGIRVDEFSIGFGPKLFSYKPGPTEYKVSLLPLGGYVKLYGEDPVAESEGDEEKAKEIADSPDAFSAKPISKRMAVALAGPAMNLLLCLIIMPIVFMLGRQVPAILEQSPKVIGLKSDSPAEKAGFLEGDLILSINGEKTENWSDTLNWVLLHPNEKAEVIVKRGAETKTLHLETIESPLTKEAIGYAGFEPQFFIGNDPQVGRVTPDMPAAQAGLEAGDIIKSIDGQEISFWTEMTDKIRASEGKELQLMVERDGERFNTTLQATYNEALKTHVIGITQYQDPNFFVKKQYPFTEAIVKGTEENIKLLKLTGDVLGRLFTFQLSYKALGGPIQIAQASGAAARSGLGEFLYFLAFLSLQLGILNLLPIPVLDGGHVAFMLVEAARGGKPVSQKIRHSLSLVGMMALLSLMLLVTVNDVDRVWGFTNIVDSIKGLFN